MDIRVSEFSATPMAVAAEESRRIQELLSNALDQFLEDRGLVPA